MKTVGLIGGLSWESSAEYYRLMNEEVKRRLGGLHSAKSVMYSFDFQEVEELQHQGRWNEAARLMVEAAQQVERGGADLLLICSNTMHRMADEVQKSIKIPLLHIADATGEQIVARGLKKVGLLATGFTMEQDFYKGRLNRLFDLNVLIPSPEGRKQVHKIIYEELCLGEIKESSRQIYKDIMANLVSQGAEGIILGCTEIGLLVKPEDSSVSLFDTTKIHVNVAVTRALE